MNTSKAQQIILASAVLTLIAGVYGARQQGHAIPSGKFLIGFGLTFTVLSALAEVEPEVANALSLAILTTAVINEAAVNKLAPKGELPGSQAATVKRRAAPPGGAGAADAHHVAQHPVTRKSSPLSVIPGMAH